LVSHESSESILRSAPLATIDHQYLGAVIREDTHFRRSRVKGPFARLTFDGRTAHPAIQSRTAHNSIRVDDALFKLLRIFAFFWDLQRCNELDRSRDWASGHNAMHLRVNSMNFGAKALSWRTFGCDPVKRPSTELKQWNDWRDQKFKA
jgi:hypothetical protein